MCHHHDRFRGRHEDRPDHQHCGEDCRDHGYRDHRDHGDCGCGERDGGGRDHGGGCDCGCEDEGPFGFKRQFVSKAEILETLEEYLSELEKEAQGVREAIAELKAEKDAPAGE
jgi:hypothetical protein